MRLGLAGGGPMLSAMAQAYNGLPLVKSTALYHPDKKIAKKLGAQIHADVLYYDPDAFIKNVDAAEVFDLPGSREEIVTALLRAGRHVSVQKPFAKTLPEASRMIKAAKQGGAALRVNDYLFFYEPYKKLRELVRDMEVGEVCAARFRSNLCGAGGWGPMKEWFHDGNVFVHPAFDKFAFIIELLGDIESVCSYGGTMKPKKGGAAVVGFKCKAPGCYGVLELTYAPGTEIRATGLPCDDTIEIAGTDGIIWANHLHGKLTEEPWLEVRRGKKHYTLGIGSGMELDWEHSLRASAQHFLKSVSSNKSPGLTAHTAQKALAFMLAADQAVKENTEVLIR